MDLAKKDVAVVSAYIELTSKCNMTCRHCYNDSGVAGKSFIEPEEFTKMLLKLRQLHCEMIILSGGEPLIHPEICNYITRASSLGIRDISVITNGLIFNDEFARVCRQNGVTVVISMDGPDKFSYSLFRKEENFQRVQIIMQPSASVNNDPIKYELSISVLSKTVDALDMTNYAGKAGAIFARL